MNRYESWRDHAACRGTAATVNWFPERNEPTAPARRICRGCPAREPCLRDALSRTDQWGVWAGMSEQERRHVLADQRLAAS